MAAASMSDSSSVSDEESAVPANNNVQKAPTPKIRSDFPETWLFLDAKTE